MFLGFLVGVITCNNAQKSLLASRMQVWACQALLKFLLVNEFFRQVLLINKFMRSILLMTESIKRIHLMNKLKSRFLLVNKFSMIAGWLPRKRILFPARLVHMYSSHLIHIWFLSSFTVDPNKKEFQMSQEGHTEFFLTCEIMPVLAWKFNFI